MKRLEFLGDSKRQIKLFPQSARQKVGYELLRVQTGQAPADYKPMPTVGQGVEEIRIWAESGTYRVLYLARKPEAVYVLHAFQKKSQGTNKSDLELARKRFALLS